MTTLEKVVLESEWGVYDMGEGDYWLDTSEENARKNYSQFIGCSLEEVRDVRGMTEEHLRSHTYSGGEGVSWTFLEQLKKIMIEEEFNYQPQFFAARYE